MRQTTATVGEVALCDQDKHSQAAQMCHRYSTRERSYNLALQELQLSRIVTINKHLTRGQRPPEELVNYKAPKRILTIYIFINTYLEREKENY